MNDRTALIEKTEILQNLLVSHATGGEASDFDYKKLRGELLADPILSRVVPRFIKTSRDLAQFWGFIKYKFASYQERREYIWKEFSPLFQQLEGASSSPADELISTVLEQFDSAHVEQIWHQALARRTEDPEGAVTSARTLLESVCKNILDDAGVSYEGNSSLPKLYSLTAEQLNLAPSQHTEQISRQILGGCQTVVEGLGAARNRLSDAHGKGRAPVKPAPHHAELAVNLAGTMATFLIRTWEARSEEVG